MDDYHIRELRKSEWEILRDFRLLAVLSDPAASGISHEELLKKADYYWVSMMSKRRYFVIYHKISGEIAGCVSLFKDVDQVWSIGWLWVSHENRGLGLGKKILGHVLEVAKNVGIEFIELGCNYELVDAISLYKKMGFKEREVLSGVTFGDGKQYDELIMRIDL